MPQASAEKSIGMLSNVSESPRFHINPTQTSGMGGNRQQDECRDLISNLQNGMNALAQF